MSKSMVWIGITIGGLIGGWIGSVIGHGPFSAWSLILSAVGSLGGIWAVYRLTEG